VCCIYANKDTGIYSSYVRCSVFSGVLESENLTSNALTQNTRTRIAVINNLYRGLRAVPLQTITTWHSNRKQTTDGTTEQPSRSPIANVKAASQLVTTVWSTRHALCKIKRSTRHMWQVGHVTSWLATGDRTLRHQDCSAPVQNSAKVSRDNSAPDFYWCRTVRTLRQQCRNTSRHFGTIRQKYIWYGLLFRQNRLTISTICRDLPILQLVQP